MPWLHLPELSVNLDRVCTMRPQSDGVYVLEFLTFNPQGEPGRVIISGKLHAELMLEAIGRPASFPDFPGGSTDAGTADG
jgi:hypothetical protein